MKKVDKIVVPDVVREFLKKISLLGGKAKSEKKTLACRLNGNAPCHPGKKRGRPPGSKNKKK